MKGLEVRVSPSEVVYSLSSPMFHVPIDDRGAAFPATHPPPEPIRLIQRQPEAGGESLRAEGQDIEPAVWPQRTEIHRELRRPRPSPRDDTTLQLGENAGCDDVVD